MSFSMLKYPAFLLLIVGIALFYVFIKDPCNQQLSTDFSNLHPGYKILNSGASEGSPESVRCRISYQKPDSEEVHEEFWLYRYSRSGWEFSKILGNHETEQTNRTHDEHAGKDDQRLSTGGTELLRHFDRGSQYATLD